MALTIMIKSKILAIFQQKNQCQHRLNYALTRAKQLMKSPMAAKFLQEGMQESSLMGASSYPLKIFQARDELPFVG